ncbi:uncharacterized protein [Periplaneta americana]|uniref:uncharacterized protein isoform X1 n=1 Tax=Periplaneta americana TaxID=6978 RepID=UPI0037E97796
MLQRVSANIKLPESDPDLSHAVVSVCERMFTNKQPVVITVPTKRVYHVTSAEERAARKYRHLKTVTIPQNSQCHTNKNSSFIVIYPPELLRATLSEHNKPYFSHIWIQGVDTLLHTLHTRGLWSVLLAPVNDHLTLWKKSEHQNFILTVKYKHNNLKQLDSEISEQLTFHHSNILQNHSGHFVVVVMGDSVTEDITRRIFTSLLKSRYFDSVVIVRTSEDGYIKAFYPNSFCVISPEPILFGMWIEHNGEGRFLANANFVKERIEQNFTGCCFEAMQSLTDPFVIRKYPERAGGLDNRLADIATEVLKVANSCDRNSLGVVIRNTVSNMYYKPHYDFTTTYFTRSYKFFVPVAQMHPRWASLIRVFTPLAWISLLASIVFTSLVLRILTAWISVKDSNTYDGIVHCLLNLLCAILAVAVDKIPHSAHLRMLFLSWIIFSITINTVFQTFFTSYMVDPGRQHQIDTVQEIRDQNYTLIFDELDAFSTYSSKYDITNQSYVASTSVEAVDAAFHTEYSAVLIDEDFFTYYSKKLCGEVDYPFYHRFSGESLQMHVHMMVEGGRYMFLRWNQVLGRLVQAGIARKLMRDITDPLGRLSFSRAALDLREEYVPMSLDVIQSPFIFLSLGLLMSFIGLLVEVVIHWAERSGISSIRKRK